MPTSAQFFMKQNFIVTSHQLITNAHELAEHVRRTLIERDVVAKALTHLLLSVESFENGHNHRDLLRHSFLPLQVPPDHNIEKLVRSPELDIGLDLDGIPSLHDRVLNLVRTNSQPSIDPFAEVLADQHLLKCHAAVQFDDFLKAHAFEPFAIENDSGAIPTQDLEGLILLAPRVFQALFVCPLGTRRGSAAGIANHGSEVADN